MDRLLKIKWFDETVVLSSPAPKTPTPPKEPPKPPVTRKSFKEKGERQQRRDTALIRELHDSDAIVKAAVQYFREIGANDAAFVLNTMKDDPQGIGADLRKLLKDSPEKLPQVSKAQCLAYILDRGMTRIDWEETCKLVNTPGNYRLPSYSVLGVEKQKTRPTGKHIFHHLLIAKQASNLLDKSSTFQSPKHCRIEVGNYQMYLQVCKFHPNQFLSFQVPKCKQGIEPWRLEEVFLDCLSNGFSNQH